MPLIRIDNLDYGTKMALWKMTENVEDLPQPYGVDFSDIHSKVRLKEKLVTYNMLQALTLRKDLVINHLPSGMPIVSGYEISLSHTKGWAAMLISQQPVSLGIDIEYYSDRVNKVADRFIRTDEQSDTLSHRLVNWSAKETVYKAFSSEDLQYAEMKLLPFTPNQEGEVTVEDLKIAKRINVDFILNKDYVLTWTIIRK